MPRSSRRGTLGVVAITMALGVSLWSCANGQGVGEVSGFVFAPDCGIDTMNWELNPDFFVHDPWENTAVIRIQNGSNYQDLSDGIIISVSDVDEVRARLGTPIDLAAEDAPVAVTLTLDGTCRPSRRDPSVVLAARAGTITFDALYSPDRGGGRENSATMDGLILDDGEGEGARAALSGSFAFLFARGRPGQRFP